MTTAVSVGVIGLDRWGVDLATAFAQIPRVDLRWVCDEEPEVGVRRRLRLPGVRLTSHLENLLEDEELDAVVVAGRTPGRHQLVRKALEAEKHVLAEGPLAVTSRDADELVRLAERRDLKLMVGDEALFHPAIQRLKELIELGRLGETYYLNAAHHRPATAPAGTDVLWSLGRYDLPVLLHLLGDEPVEVWARGESYVEDGVPDVVFCFLRFATGITAYLHLSSLDPCHVRRLAVVGSQRMAIFDEKELGSRLTVYARGRRQGGRSRSGGYAEVLLDDSTGAEADWEDPVRRQCDLFLAGIRSRTELWAARRGAAVVNVLESLERSLATGGLPEPVRDAPERAPVPLALASRRRH